MGRSRNSDDVIGIDVGTGGIKVALVRDGVPIHLSQVTFGDGVVQNGELADPRLIQKILKALWDRERLPTKRVRLGLAHPSSALRPMSTPDPGDDDDLRRAIELNAGAVIAGFDPTQTAFGYQVIGRQDSMLDVAIASLPTSIVREWSRVIDRAGLDLVGLELSVAATGRALFDSGMVRLVVDIGSQYTTLALVEPGNAVRHLLVIQGGGDTFTEALLPLTGGDVARAEQLKRACGIGTEPVGVVDLNTFREALAAMAPARDLLVSRLSDALAMMERTGAQHPVQIILTGGGARLGGLHEAIARYLTSSAAPPVLNSQLAAAPDADLYATALALSAGAGASLLPPAKRRGRGAGRSKKSSMGRKRVPVGRAAAADSPAPAPAKDAPRPAGGRRPISPVVMGLIGAVAGAAAIWGTSAFLLSPAAEDAAAQSAALEGRPEVERASVNPAIQRRINQATDILRDRIDVASPLKQWPAAARIGGNVTRLYFDPQDKRFVVDIQTANPRQAEVVRNAVEGAIAGSSVLPGTGRVVRVELTATAQESGDG